MELRSILGSGVVRLIETSADDKLVLAQDVVQALADRYRFWEFPTKPSDFNLDDTNNGAAFNGGAFGDTPIQRMRLYRRGIAADAPEVPTDRLEQFLEDVLAFGAHQFGLKFVDTGAVKRAFNSSVEVQMTEGFGRRLDALTRVGAAMDAAIIKYGFNDTSYQFGELALVPADEVHPLKPAPFKIERRVNYALSENIFYSQAPLATSDHLQVLRVLDESF